MTELQSLLGLLNSFKNFIPNMTQLLPNIRSLLWKDRLFLEGTMREGVQGDQGNNIRTSGVKTVCTRMVNTVSYGFQRSRNGLHTDAGQ